MDPEDPMNPQAEDETQDEAEDDATAPAPAPVPAPADRDEHASSDETTENFAAEGFERWRRDSALGSVGTGIARGLQNVFAPPPNPPVIVASVPGDPPDPERLQVILDPDDPSKSVAVVPPAHEAGDDDPPA
jgi:hypothetical protein